MIVRCSWHGGIVGEKPPYGILEGKNWDKEVTDTICPKCQKKLIKEVKND